MLEFDAKEKPIIALYSECANNYYEKHMLGNFVLEGKQNPIKQGKQSA